MAISVPDNDIFGLSHVYAAVGDHAPSVAFELVDCHAKALAPYFDATYNSRPSDGLMIFRNYGPPPGNPVTGTETLPFESYGVGRRAIGLLIYVSPDGNHLYVLLQVQYATVAYQLVHFVMSNFDLSTAVYVGERNVGSPPSGQIWKQLVFSDSGDRFSLLADSHLRYVGDNSRIQTWRLDTNWDVTDVGSYEETYPKQDPALSAYQSNFVAMAYMEDGNTLAILQRFDNAQYLNFYDITNFVLPTGNITADSSSYYATADIGNQKTGLNIFDSSLSPGQTTLGVVTPGSDFALIKVKITSSPWNTYYALSTIGTYTPFSGYNGSYTQDSLGYTYVLEHNENASDPLYPRIYLKVH